MVVLGVHGNVFNFPIFEEKIVKGSIIGTRKDMTDLVAIATSSDLQVFIEEHRLVEANEVRERLKNSQVKACAVLVP